MTALLRNPVGTRLTLLLAWCLLFFPAWFGDRTKLGLLHAGLSALLLWPLLLSRVTRLPTLLVLMLVGAGNMVHVGYHGKLMDEFLLASITRTTSGELREFLATVAAAPMFTGALWLVLASAAGWVLWRHKTNRRVAPRSRWQRVLLGFVIVLWLVLLLWAWTREPGDPERMVRRLRHVYPMQLVDAAVQRRIVARNLFYEPVLPSRMPRSERVDTVVLVLGESASAARWSLLGYTASDTNQSLRWVDGLHVARGAARGLTTAAAVPYLLTGLSAADSIAQRAPSFLDLAHAQGGGYKIFVYTNSRFFDREEDFITHTLRRSADVYRKVGDAAHDGVLTPYLETALADPAERKLVVLHTYGSHVRTSDRYPHSYASDDPYDSSTRYTSDLLARWIELLDRSATGGTALLAYTSDHGMVLPPCASEPHHGRALSSIEVPMLVWGNAALRAHRPALLPTFSAEDRLQANHGNALVSRLLLESMGFAEFAQNQVWSQAVQPEFEDQPLSHWRARNACTLR